MPLHPHLPLCVSLRVADNTHSVHPSVKVSRCVVCEAEILLSPSSMNDIALGQLQPVCLQCAERQGVRLLAVSGEGVNELGEFEKWLSERN